MLASAVAAEAAGVAAPCVLSAPERSPPGLFFLPACAAAGTAAASAANLRRVKRAQGELMRNIVAFTPCRPLLLPLRAERLHQPVEERLALIKRLHRHAFIAPVHAHIIDIQKESLNAIRRNSGGSQIEPVCGPRRHHRNC